jgi:hypothetical protein
MIFKISESYWEVIRQDTMSEYMDIKLQLSECIYQSVVFDMCTTGYSIHMKLLFQFHSYVLQQRDLSLLHEQSAP